MKCPNGVNIIPSIRLLREMLIMQIGYYICF